MVFLESLKVTVSLLLLFFSLKREGDTGPLENSESCAAKAIFFGSASELFAFSFMVFSNTWPSMSVLSLILKSKD